MAGLTPEGLEIRRLPDVLEENRNRAREIFADLVAGGDTVDVGDNSALGRMIGVVSPAQAELWEALQQIHDSFNPHTASGYALDNLVALSGITRHPARPTSAQVIFTGINGTVITTAAKVLAPNTRRLFSLLSPVTLDGNYASGVELGVGVANADEDYVFRYSTDGGVNFLDIPFNAGPTPTIQSILAGLKAQIDIVLGSLFTTTIEGDALKVTRNDPFQVATFAVSENVTISKVSKLGVVVSDTLGPLGQAANTIDTISVPVVGWESVTNPLPATAGRLEESDEELRERFRNSKFVQAANIIDALVDALNNVAGVTDVIVYENDTREENDLGMPPNSFMPIVLGGLNTTVAEAIWQNKPLGIPSVGDTTVNVVDSQGIPHAISFRRPRQVPIYINVSITDVGGMSGEAPVQIAQNIFNYATDAYRIGDNVLYSRFYTPVNSVAGHVVNSLTIGTEPNPTGMSNIVIDFDEVASFSIDRITVTVV